jgi:hypothetical protein
MDFYVDLPKVGYNTIKDVSKLRLAAQQLLSTRNTRAILYKIAKKRAKAIRKQKNELLHLSVALYQQISLNILNMYCTFVEISKQ